MQGRVVECGAMIFMDIDCLDFVQEQITTTYGESWQKWKQYKKVEKNLHRRYAYELHEELWNASKTRQ